MTKIGRVLNVAWVVGSIFIAIGCLFTFCYRLGILGS